MTDSVVNLKRTARNPESFRLKSALVMGNGAVCYTYRAANGFGVMSRGSAVMSKSGAIYTSETDGDRFSRSWQHDCKGKSGEEFVEQGKG